MRLKNFAAAVAASSLMLASTPALSAGKLSLATIERAGAARDGESSLADGGFIAVAIIFGAGMLAGALLYSVIKGGDEEEPVSP